MTSISEAVATAIKHFEAGRIQSAEQILRQIIQVQPSHVDARHWLGTVCETQGRLDEAETHLRYAICLQPDLYEPHTKLGQVLMKQKKYADAVDCYQHALILNPEDANVHNSLGLAYEALDELDDAILSYRRAVHLKPNDCVAYNNLGSAVQKQGNFNEAVACYQHAVALQPDYAIAHSNMGLAFQKQNRLDYAVTCYQNALMVNPDSAEARYNLGMTWLQLGEFAAGWPEFDARIKLKKLPEFRKPKWDGSRLTGRRILLYAEQGLGDTIQFIRYAKVVKGYGGHVIVACQPRLISLLKTCEGIDVLVPQPQSSADSLPAFDFYIHLLSVPMVVGTTADTIPCEVPYLSADERLVEQWGRELQKEIDLKVGLAWQGNRMNPIDRGRSIRLSEFEPLGRVQGVKFFSLQKDDGSEQVRSVAGRLEVTDLSAALDETEGAFVQTAAVMKNLDLVITCDTSIAHLAGALGVPVWVALNHSPDWRWMLGREDSPWYPTMRLFRQGIPGDWAGVFRNIAAELRRFGLVEGSAERPLITEPTTTASPASEMIALVETSIGELVDKMTILEIKSAKLTDSKKLTNVKRELDSVRLAYAKMLGPSFKDSPKSAQLDQLISQLKQVNESLWKIEDAIRGCEQAKEFGTEFIQLARSVYRENDLRADLRRQISELLGSRIIEEKCYRDYDTPTA